MFVDDLYDAISLAPRHRVDVVRALREISGLEWTVALRVELEIARFARDDRTAYTAHASRVAYNLACNPSLITSHEAAVLPTLDDHALARGSIVESIRNTEAERTRAFTDMLHDRYESVRALASDKTSLLRCRACGATDIAWRQVQTRSADEPMTVFCSCMRCKARWRL
jgi:DNA-directed RNA polymerase subunit M/transcription elongation factor TFIIS